jgi:hypothetical protein
MEKSRPQASGPPHIPPKNPQETQEQYDIPLPRFISNRILVWISGHGNYCIRGRHSVHPHLHTT